ncbi:MAG: CooT family nickel-binding protein [Oscillospiraceae bacterium]|jgi:predicted RNA-binding protein|nr:CooT family nickel-binding protein [Oscillospiraceae bacterium]MBQ8929546.1 CooT family nickel-binding protein [Oscillospiraceae bacterium]MBR6430138.1 CooT family nickel-binding protein [Oscillospiraceae bacterium]
MCLSKVFQIVNGTENQVCEYVSQLKLVNDKIVLTDIMGLETVVTGKVTGVDLVNNRITIEA